MDQATLDEKAMGALFKTDGERLRLTDQLIDRLDAYSAGDLKRLKGKIKAYKEGNTNLRTQFPLLDLAAAVSSAWTSGYTAGAKVDGQPARIVVFVEGGVVQAVYSDRDGMQVRIFDKDNDDYAETNADIVTTETENGRTYHAVDRELFPHMPEEF